MCRISIESAHAVCILDIVGLNPGGLFKHSWMKWALREPERLIGKPLTDCTRGPDWLGKMQSAIFHHLFLCLCDWPAYWSVHRLLLLLQMAGGRGTHFQAGGIRTNVSAHQLVSAYDGVLRAQPLHMHCRTQELGGIVAVQHVQRLQDCFHPEPQTRPWNNSAALIKPNPPPAWANSIILPSSISLNLHFERFVHLIEVSY